MKKIFTILLSSFATTLLTAQVTQLNNNNSLEFSYPLGNGKAVMPGADQTLWVTDATPAGTFQLSNSMYVDYDWAGGILNNKFIFPGKTAALGIELWISDGTKAGTSLLKDINPGAGSSLPDDDFALLNGFLYFTAETPGEGRELWRTDGTTNGTTLVKDIKTGPAQSALRGKYNLFSNGQYLLMNIATLTEGYELWRSDGTAVGTVMLKDINPGIAASDPDNFEQFNNLVLFSAKTAANGIELWKTDGTETGTQLVKDIKAGTGDGFNYLYVFQFNNKAYFVANDGEHGDEMWSTDGFTANTFLVKDIEPGFIGGFGITSLFSAIKYGNKFIFTAWNQDYDVELWESDGTTAGTKIFKEIAEGMESGMPFLLAPFSISNPGNQQLYQGNKFFFLMVLPASGFELWVSDGTANGTNKVKTINTNETSGIDNLSYTYTSNGLYFVGDDGIKGEEVWFSNGTEAGTGMVTDINPGAENAGVLFYGVIIDNKLLFQATNGDSESSTDLYAINIGGNVLPVVLGEFTGQLVSADALLQWYTLQEIESKDFSIERSFDGIHFEMIGTVPAAGSSVTKRNYVFTDKNIINSKKALVYYRLILNDKNGKSSYSKIVSLKLKGTPAWNLSLLNNPVPGNLQYRVSGVVESLQLTIKDVSGKNVYNGKIASDGTYTISVSNLSPGLYFLVAEDASQKRVLKFIKQ
ncbi:MAG: T9SS type A sorting domain-containing protein [Bacteroidota bacterium]